MHVCVSVIIQHDTANEVWELGGGWGGGLWSLYVTITAEHVDVNVDMFTAKAFSWQLLEMSQSICPAIHDGCSMMDLA